MKVFRQGDVLLVQVKALPKESAISKREDGQIILAFGEVTGHAHRIAEPAKAKLWSAQAERYLQVLETTSLAHEEHSAVELAPGIYQVAIQTDYTPQELRRVTD